MSEGPSQPGMEQINAAQRKEVNLRRQAAAGRFYRRAKRRQLAGGSLVLILALLAPIIFFLAPSSGPLLGAIAGGWIFVSRILVVPLRDRCRTKSALAQEMFDCDVLGLPWNSSPGKVISRVRAR